MNLRIDAERGPILAAGGVLLAAAVGMLAIRLESSWGKGVHLIVELAAFAVIFGMAWLSPLAERPLAYQSTLAVTGLVLLVVVLFRLADVFGVENTGNAGTLIWISAMFTLVAGLAATRFASVASALFACIGAAVFAVAVIDKVFDPHGFTTFRWVFFLLTIVFAVAAAGLGRGPRPGFAVAAVNAAGLMLLALLATFVVSEFAYAFAALDRDVVGESVSGPGWGWKLVLVVGSLAVIAYAAVRRERGPGFIGGFALLLAIVVIGRPHEEASVVGWPVLLLLAAGATLALGLAPRGGGGGGGGASLARTPGPPPAPETRQQPPPAP